MKFPFILCGYNAGFKYKYKSISLVRRFTGIIQFIFCRSNMHMYFLLIRAVEMLQKTTSTVFISLLDTQTCY